VNQDTTKGVRRRPKEAAGKGSHRVRLNVLRGLSAEKHLYPTGAHRSRERGGNAPGKNLQGGKVNYLEA